MQTNQIDTNRYSNSTAIEWFKNTVTDKLDRDDYTTSIVIHLSWIWHLSCENNSNALAKE